MTHQEAEPSVGFVPRELRAGAQAKKADDAQPDDDSDVPDHYRRAFGGRPIPKFKPRG